MDANGINFVNIKHCLVVKIYTNLILNIKNLFFFDKIAIILF